MVLYESSNPLHVGVKKMTRLKRSVGIGIVGSPQSIQGSHGEIMDVGVDVDVIAQDPTGIEKSGTGIRIIVLAG